VLSRSPRGCVISSPRVMYFVFKVSFASLPSSRRHQLTHTDEYRSLQSLHLWRPTLMTPTSLNLTYDAEIQLSMACIDSLPDISTARVNRLPLDEGAKVGRAVGYAWKGRGESPTVGLFRLFEGAVGMLAGVEGQHISTVCLSRISFVVRSDAGDVLESIADISVHTACRSTLVRGPTDPARTPPRPRPIPYRLHIHLVPRRSYRYSVPIINDTHVPREQEQGPACRFVRYRHAYAMAGVRG
jgi:hypothetical protein